MVNATKWHHFPYYFKILIINNHSTLIYIILPIVSQINNKAIKVFLNCVAIAVKHIQLCYAGDQQRKTILDLVVHKDLQSYKPPRSPVVKFIHALLTPYLTGLSSMMLI